MDRLRLPMPHLAVLGVLVASLLLFGCPPASDDGGGTPAREGTVEMLVDGDPTISFMVWVKAGSQNDPPGKEGLAALTAALVSQGATTENSFESILEQLYPIASRYGARVDLEMTTIVGRTHVDNLDVFFPLFTDAYLKPAFDAADFERLKSNQLNFLETGLRYAQDEELGKAALRLGLYEGGPYAHPVQGSVDGLNAITIDDIQAFYAEHYTRGNVSVAIAGGYDEALRVRFEETVDTLPDGAATTAPEIGGVPLEGRRVLLVEKPGADASISFGHPITVQRGDDDFYALWIANSWLGEHRNTSSHLFQVIRETRGLNYGDYSYIEAFPEGGQRQMPPTNVARRQQLFEGWIRTLPNEQGVFALRAALREIDELINEGMSEEEFQLTRAFLSKYHLHFAATTTARLGYRVDDAFYGIGGAGHLARFGETMQQLTRDEVNAAVKRHLQTENLQIAIVTGDAEGLTRQLTSGEPTPITYGSAKPQEVLDEDEIIAAYPLDIAADAVSVITVDEIFQK
ncbi:MAG: pitrilysin family protein [Acidobacteriota bacterium]